MKPAYERILRALNLFHVLTIKQTAKLTGFNPETSYTTVSTLMTELFKHGLVDYGMLPHEKARGGATKLYILTPSGRDALRGIGIVSEGRQLFKPEQRASTSGEQAKKLGEYWRHVMLSTDFFITAHLWQAQQPEVVYRRMLTELDIYRDKAHYPVPLELPNFRPGGVIPDGLLEVVHPVYQGFRFWLEVERDQYHESDFRLKIRALVAFAEGPNLSLYGTRTLTILIVATKGEEHCKKLLRWIAMELQELGKQNYAPLFRVTAVPPDALQLFTQAVWYIPMDTAPHALFSG